MFFRKREYNIANFVANLRYFSDKSKSFEGTCNSALIFMAIGIDKLQNYHLPLHHCDQFLKGIGVADGVAVANEGDIFGE